MKVLFLSRLFYPHIGGVEKHVIEISKRLIAKNIKVIIVTERHNSSLKLWGKMGGLEVYRIPNFPDNWFKKFFVWFWMLKNVRLMVSSDVVHCHDVFFWYLPFRFIFLTKPVFTTFHGYEEYPLSKKTLLIRKLSEKLSWGNICVGDFMKKWYGTNPDYVIYGGVNKIKNSKLKIENLKQKVRLGAVFIGRLDEQTGILTYCEAVKKIREKFPKFKFVVAGDGPYRAEVEKTTRFLGFTENPESFFPLYRFAFVSRYLSILEAMAAKRLVFAVYDNPIKKDYLILSPFSEFIVTANSSEELIRKLTWFIDHPEEERKIIKKAYEFAAKQSWSRLTNIYLNLWKTNR